MLKEFHYYLTKILSITAGFAEDDAQTIAYACQYVDDANEINKRKILGLPDVGQHLYKNQTIKGQLPLIKNSSWRQYLTKQERLCLGIQRR